MDGGGGIGGGGGIPGWPYEPGEDPGGPRRGRRFGDGASWGGRRGTALLVLAVALMVLLFVAVSCLA